MLDKQAEQELVAAAQQGSESAIQKLYDEYLPPIHRFFYAQMGNREDAEDISQDTLCEAFAGLEKFSGRARFKNWLYQIAKNKLADWWREKYNKPTLTLEDFCPVASEPDIFFDEEDTSTKEADEKSGKVLNMLPENYRTVLECRFLKNFSLKETAAIMNTTEGNVKVMQFRALKKASQFVNDIYE